MDVFYEIFCVASDLLFEYIVLLMWAKVQTRKKINENLVKFHAHRSVLEGVHRVLWISSKRWKKLQIAKRDRDRERAREKERERETERGGSVTATDYFQPFRIHYRGSILLCLKSTTEQCIIRKWSHGRQSFRNSSVTRTSSVSPFLFLAELFLAPSVLLFQIANEETPVGV